MGDSSCSTGVETILPPDDPFFLFFLFLFLPVSSRTTFGVCCCRDTSLVSNIFSCLSISVKAFLLGPSPENEGSIRPGKGAANLHRREASQKEALKEVTETKKRRPAAFKRMIEESLWNGRIVGK